MSKLIFVALLASCEGRCRPVEAVTDEVPGALCASSFDSSTGLCLRGDEVFVCSIQGIVWHTAQCRSAGKVQR
jgi:hypothetical protein